MGKIVALEEAEELRLIMESQTGNETAMLRLIEVYTPLIERVARSHSHGDNYEDALQESHAAFIKVVYDHDLNRGHRLYTYIGARLGHELAEAISTYENSWGIPPRTIKLYYQILRAADDDPHVGAEIARDYQMNPLTFTTIHDMLSNTDSIDYVEQGEEGGAPLTDTYGGPLLGGDVTDSYNEVLERLSVEAMMQDALSDEHVTIVRMAYGFEGPLSVGEDDDVHPAASSVSLAAHDDGTVAAALTWRGDKVYTRPTVQRRRAAQLKAWRESYSYSQVEKG